MIPEVDRREAHISLIEPTHPLLPIALECLKDEAVERPSSQQLCQSLDALKRDARVEENSQQDTNRLLQEKDTQIQLKIQQLREKDANIAALRDEIETKIRQLQDKADILKTKDEIISARDSSLLSVRYEVEASKRQLREKDIVLIEKDKQIQALKSEVEAKEDQLNKLGQNTESNKAANTSQQESKTVQTEREVTEPNTSKSSDQSPKVPESQPDLFDYGNEEDVDEYNDPLVDGYGQNGYDNNGFDAEDDDLIMDDPYGITDFDY